jgi:hypothetical protein
VQLQYQLGDSTLKSEVQGAIGDLIQHQMNEAMSPISRIHLSGNREEKMGVASLSIT